MIGKKVSALRKYLANNNGGTEASPYALDEEGPGIMAFINKMVRKAASTKAGAWLSAHSKFPNWVESFTQMVNNTQAREKVLTILTLALEFSDRFPEDSKVRKYLRRIGLGLGAVRIASDVVAMVANLFTMPEVHQSPVDLWKNHMRIKFNRGRYLEHMEIDPTEVVSVSLFRRHLLDFVEIHELSEICWASKCAAMDDSTKDVSVDDFMKCGLPNHLISGYFTTPGGSQEAVGLHIKGDKIDVLVVDQNARTAFVSLACQHILGGLQENLIEISSTDERGYYDKLYNLALYPLHKAEFWDEDIYASVAPIVNNSIKLGIKTGILVYGEIGVSKTTTINHIMQEVDALKVRVTNTGYNSAKVLLAGIHASKIVLIDDIDTKENEEKTKENTELLNFLDSDCYDVAIVIVNTLKIMAPLLRSGRCDVKVFCEKPTEAKRLKILMGLGNRHDIKFSANELDAVVLESEGMNHADLHNIVKTSLRLGCSLSEACNTVIAYNAIITDNQDDSEDDD